MKIEITLTETLHGDVGVGMKITDNSGEVLQPEKRAAATQKEMAYAAAINHLFCKAIPMIGKSLGATEIGPTNKGPMPKFVRKPVEP
jgi:hypothetical protein